MLHVYKIAYIWDSKEKHDPPHASIKWLSPDSDSEIIYSATYHTITIFTYIWFQNNELRRPQLRQNYIYRHVHIHNKYSSI